MLAVPLVRVPPPLEEQIEQAARQGAQLVELRADLIGDVAAVERALRAPRRVPLILTVRAAEEGGGWDGDDAERVALLERLGLLLPGYLDVEYATWTRSANLRQKIGLVADVATEGLTQGHGSAEKKRNVGLAKGNEAAVDMGRATWKAASTARPKNQLILSHHDLRETPANLDAVFDALAATPAPILKAVFAARDARDALRVLEQLHRRRGGRQKIIALAMGEAGIVTRVLARKFEAFLTFAALERGAESAPGQLALADLAADYPVWPRIGPATRVYGVVGWPVTHSLSPRAHNLMMARDGVDGVYVPLPVAPQYEAFATFMDDLVLHSQLDFYGLSVTLPHKEHALRWLDGRGWPVTGLARRCGAVNTLTRRADGAWEGENTDAPGLLAALETIRVFRGAGLRGRRVAVLGAGGAARAAVAALLERGGRVTLYNRTAERAEGLARELGCDWRPWGPRAAHDAEILINCTRVGLWPHVADSPMPPEGLRKKLVTLDTIYKPYHTQLLRDARARGGRIIPGLKMFVAQAVAQYERWHGKPPPPAAVKILGELRPV